MITLDNSMTVNEAAQMLGRNPETVRRWIRELKLPAKKIGMIWLIRRDDLAKL